MIHNTKVVSDKGGVVKKARYSGQRLSDRIENIKLDEYYSKKKTSVADRILQANQSIDVHRDNELKSSGKIGQVTGNFLTLFFLILSHFFLETRKKYDFANIFANRKAPFEWQRLENKMLGRGSFGSVYLVMNLRDNCLM
jgi:hypothetical protein